MAEALSVICHSRLVAGFKIVMGSEWRLCFESWGGGGTPYMKCLIKVFLSDQVFSLSWHCEKAFQEVGLQGGVLFSPFSAFTEQPSGKGKGGGRDAGQHRRSSLRFPPRVKGQASESNLPASSSSMKYQVSNAPCLYGRGSTTAP